MRYAKGNGLRGVWDGRTIADHIGSFGQTITHVSWAQAEKRRREPSIQEDHGNST